MRLNSRRLALTASMMMPQVRLMNASCMMLAARIAVGRRGTRPGSVKVTTSGRPGPGATGRRPAEAERNGQQADEDGAVELEGAQGAIHHEDAERDACAVAIGLQLAARVLRPLAVAQGDLGGGELEIERVDRQLGLDLEAGRRG